MSCEIRFTESALDDLLRLYEFLADEDINVARQARMAIHKAMDVLADMPFVGRMIDRKHPLMRELIITFGSRGYVALYEIETQALITVYAFRHQRERDYYL
ncbi:type II toxin-antitoxin system RelE/ParE family toxin [Dyella sp.]|uniref:type II toxin-antitoxin system RelE/ParE family toxin n=1 Tax=Dyella sp. TaxID=1869338 RepID=UPI002B49B02E|nr:type II toxin-antitoxin system RelE/ParE family toxin [Dyella sp.]HKT29662.1 type II toxin-antitoxin system RelE/ParE family toxin [Dyella sp.]